MIKLENGTRVIHANLLVDAICHLRRSPRTGRIRRWVPIDDVLAIIWDNSSPEIVAANTEIEVEAGDGN